jgi:hypothetical protein
MSIKKLVFCRKNPFLGLEYVKVSQKLYYLLKNGYGYTSIAINHRKCVCDTPPPVHSHRSEGFLPNTPRRYKYQ